MIKFKNKYRIETTRLKNWDYGWNGAYFITICTQNRIYYFGEIENQKMQLSEIGKMAEKYWYEIPAHFPFAKLDAFVVMPNHIHGIIIIDKPDYGRVDKRIDERVDGRVNGCVDGRNVETQNFASLQPSQLSQSPSQPSSPKNKFGPQSQNLASIIRGYKIGVSKNARKIAPDFVWQSRFYDHIIRNQKSFNKISEYIVNNPINWNQDEFH
jgi:REP element-mobilizing transposase RayT